MPSRIYRASTDLEYRGSPSHLDSIDDLVRVLAVMVDCDFQLRDEERWFIAQTLHQRENLASLHLAAQNFTRFLPLFHRWFATPANCEI